MRGEVLFEKMSGISEDYIAEAALVPAVGVVPTKKRPFATLFRALNSGWGVACICFAVAIAAVVGMAAWGRMGGLTGPTADPSVRFTFSYEMRNAGGDAWNGHVMPGDTVYLDTITVNQGKPFTYEGSSSEFCASAKFVLQGDDSVVITGFITHTTDLGTFTVETGEEGQGNYSFYIPREAVPGVYDLVLSYKGQTQSFENVVIVTELTAENPDVLYNLTMPIGSDWLYESLDEAYVAGDEVTVRIKFATDVGTLFFLNGERIPTEVGDDQMGYWEYSFYMPAQDSEIRFKTFDGSAPYSDILEAYHVANPEADQVAVTYDYGTFGDGVRVALITDGRYEYTQALETHRIGPAEIRYTNGNFIQVLYEGEFHSLSKAYEAGILTDGNMAAIENLQREFFFYLYADDE